MSNWLRTGAGVDRGNNSWQKHKFLQGIRRRDLGLTTRGTELLQDANSFLMQNQNERAHIVIGVHQNQ